MAVIELKASHEGIDEDAGRQTLSYARPVEPMALQAIVTNDKQTLVLRSLDGAEIASQIFDEAAIAMRFADAGVVAGASYDDAVRDLLARDDAIFAALLRF
ncbi:MAG: hypothetical protein PS018_23810 [bacterium]|nr:hypothetical protein [bacterium]